MCKCLYNRNGEYVETEGVYKYIQVSIHINEIHRSKYLWDLYRGGEISCTNQMPLPFKERVIMDATTKNQQLALKGDNQEIKTVSRTTPTRKRNKKGILLQHITWHIKS